MIFVYLCIEVKIILVKYCKVECKEVRYFESLKKIRNLLKWVKSRFL